MAAAGRAHGRIGDAWRSGPMGSTGFRLLSAGQFLSTTGDYCYAVALPWLVLATHGRPSGPVLLGIVLACYGVPRTALIPVGGMLADKIGPRRLMLVADAARCVLIAALAAFAAGRLSSAWALGPVAALIGAGEGLFLPASAAMMPTVLPPGQLPAANAVFTTLLRAGSLIGPVLGGALVATAGPAPAFAVDAATFAASAITLTLIRAAEPAAGAATAEDQSGPPGAAEPTVWSLLRTERLLQALLIVTITVSLTAGGTFEVALPALAHARFGAAGYGALIGCFAVGGLAGSLLSGRVKASGRPAMAALAAFAVMSVAIALTPFLWGLPGAAAAIGVVGVTNAFGNVVLLTLMQQWTPRRLLGRVMSLMLLAGFGIFPLSVVVSGLLVHRLGPAPFFPITAALIALATLGAFTQRELRQFGTDEPSADPVPEADAA